MVAIELESFQLICKRSIKSANMVSFDFLYSTCIFILLIFFFQARESAQTAMRQLLDQLTEVRKADIEKLAKKDGVIHATCAGDECVAEH